MKEKEIKILMVRFFEGRITSTETDLLLKWLEEKASHKELFNQYAKTHYTIGLSTLDAKKAFYDFEKRIKKVYLKNRIFSSLKYAAVFIAFILMGYGGFVVWNTPDDIYTKISQPTPIPTHNKATLTLADGTKVTLQNGKTFQDKNIRSTGDTIIYNKEETKITDAEIKYNHLTIPRGGQFYIVLEDGTGIWLNSDSKLTYPNTFKEGESRQVKLVYGEAYFEVSPSSAHKGAHFIVHSKDQYIEVMGTKFNLRAYQEETAAYTTLTEGKIKLMTENEQIVLNPGEQAILDYSTKNLSVEEVETTPITAWKEGVFNFENTPLSEITKVLSRWYDVDIVYKKPNVGEAHFTGILEKNQSLEEILLILKGANNIDYTLKDKKIIIK